MCSSDVHHKVSGEYGSSPIQHSCAWYKLFSALAFTQYHSWCFSDIGRGVHFVLRKASPTPNTTVRARRVHTNHTSKNAQIETQNTTYDIPQATNVTCQDGSLSSPWNVLRSSLAGNTPLTHHLSRDKTACILEVRDLYAINHHPISAIYPISAIVTSNQGIVGGFHVWKQRNKHKFRRRESYRISFQSDVWDPFVLRTKLWEVLLGGLKTRAVRWSIRWSGMGIEKVTISPNSSMAENRALMFWLHKSREIINTQL